MKDPCEPDQGNRELTTRVFGVTQNLKEVGTTKRYAEEHEVHTRQSVGVRRHKSLKPKTDTERQVVYATAMSAKEVRMYPGRSHLTHESATYEKKYGVRSQQKP